MCGPVSAFCLALLSSACLYTTAYGLPHSWLVFVLFGLLTGILVVANHEKGTSRSTCDRCGGTEGPFRSVIDGESGNPRSQQWCKSCVEKIKFGFTIG
ncbi:MAG TPA: hypothetical protein VJ801_09995 [Polyangia bacterium]|nr:hypothetical protein [Polyangia bacterium]